VGTLTCPSPHLSAPRPQPQWPFMVGSSVTTSWPPKLSLSKRQGAARVPWGSLSPYLSGGREDGKRLSICPSVCMHAYMHVYMHTQSGHITTPAQTLICVNTQRRRACVCNLHCPGSKKLACDPAGHHPDCPQSSITLAFSGSRAYSGCFEFAPLATACVLGPGILSL
jgi:hypothetical protein